jgi:proteasome lid subunit RPN8/RPN11
MPHSIQIKSAVVALLLEHARRDPRIECCGFLAGKDGLITQAFLAENVANEPSTRYEVATKEIVNVTRAIRIARLELLGIYHSHPNGKGLPSETDIATVGYPDAAYFIISPAPDVETPVRVFSIRERQVRELKLVVV